MKPRTCPHCQEQIPIDGGYHFDEQLNMLCDYCGKVVYPTTAQSQASLPTSKKPIQPSTPYRNIATWDSYADEEA